MGRQPDTGQRTLLAQHEVSVKHLALVLCNNKELCDIFWHILVMYGNKSDTGLMHYDWIYRTIFPLLLLPQMIKILSNGSKRSPNSWACSEFKPAPNLGPSGPLPDWRTRKHMENPGFAGPPKSFSGPNFFFFFFIYEIPHRGSWTATIRVFISPSAVFIGHRLRAGGFPDVCKLDNHWFGAKPYIWINAIMLVIRQYNPWEETSMKF